MAIKCINGAAPKYLIDLLSMHQPGREGLRSAEDNQLAFPRVRLKSFGDRDFSSAAPRLWNQLSVDIKSTQSQKLFLTKLKTHLFKLALNLQNA